MLLALHPAGAGAISFSDPTNFGVGSEPFSVAVGNFNADSNPDLAVANRDSDNVSILLGNGTGGFGAATNFSAGDGAFSVAVGNFNADSNPDLAVANFISDNVSILLGAGDGTFTGPTNFAAGDGANSVAVGNFNADAHPDLAVANLDSDNVSILLGAGDGSFTGPTDFAAGDGAASVAIGNFNADSNLDLAVANLNSDDVSILLGNGTGGFGAATDFDAGDGASSVAVGNFNADSHPDLAVANLGDDNVSILLGAGDGTFTGPTDFDAGAGAASVAVGNLDADSNLDLAVANAGADNVSILLGAGDGTFTGPTDFAAGDDPFSVAIGDFNANGRADLAVANLSSDNVSILRGHLELTISMEATSATIGESIRNTVTLADGSEPKGLILFAAFHAEDADCSEELLAFGSDPIAVDGNGEYESGEFTPTVAGAYRWRVAYFATDDIHAGSVSPCNALSVVAKAAPSLATATQGGTLGEAIDAAATLSGGFESTGEVVFSAYGPDDPDCSRVAAFESDPVTVDGDGGYGSGQFTPTAAGAYRWTASYGGDVNNEAAAVLCAGPDNLSQIAKATTQTALSSSPNPATVGESITFTAKVTGFEPGGEVSFEDGAEVLGEATLDAAGEATLATSALTVGARSVVASYAGDANNEASASPALEQLVEAVPAPPGPAAPSDPVKPPVRVKFQITYNPNHPHRPNPRGGPRHTFRFQADGPGLSFLCRLDRRPFRPCSSPKVYRNLKRGRHVFRVRSVDSEGRRSPVRTVRFFAGKRYPPRR